MAKPVTFTIDITPSKNGSEPKASITVAGAGALKAKAAGAVADLTEEIGKALGRIDERHKGTPHGAHHHAHRDAAGRITIHRNH